MQLRRPWLSEKHFLFYLGKISKIPSLLDRIPTNKPRYTFEYLVWYSGRARACRRDTKDTKPYRNTGGYQIPGILKPCILLKPVPSLYIHLRSLGIHPGENPAQLSALLFARPHGAISATGRGEIRVPRATEPWHGRFRGPGAVARNGLPLWQPRLKIA